MKKILYITNSIDENNQLGYRHSSILNILRASFEIDLIDFAFTKKKNNFVKKAINKIFKFPDLYRLFLFRYKRKIQSNIKQNKYSSVVIGVLPHSFLYLATFIKKINSQLKIIVDMTDPLSINVSYINCWLIYRLWIKWYEKKHLKSVDRLIVLNESIKLYYEKNYPFLEKIIVLEQGTNAYKNKLNISNNKRAKRLELVYAGMFYNNKLREPFELYKAIEIFDLPIRLSIYGSFKKKFIPPKTERYYYGGLVSKEFIRNKINEFDIVVFIDNFYGMQVPGKILESLATNKPILFIYKNELSPTLKYVQEYNGIFYSKNNDGEIVNTLKIIARQERFYYKRDLTKYYWGNLIKESYFS